MLPVSAASLLPEPRLVYLRINGGRVQLAIAAALPEGLHLEHLDQPTGFSHHAYPSISHMELAASGPPGYWRGFHYVGIDSLSLTIKPTA